MYIYGREFAYLETGSLRLMYHYNILQTDKDVTTRKIYENKRNKPTKETGLNMFKRISNLYKRIWMKRK